MAGSLVLSWPECCRDPRRLLGGGAPKHHWPADCGMGGGTCCLLYPLRKPQAMCVSGHISGAIRELLGGSFDII